MLAKSIQTTSSPIFEIAGTAAHNQGSFTLSTDGCSESTFEELANAIESAILPLGWIVDIYERNLTWRFLAFVKQQ